MKRRFILLLLTAAFWLSAGRAPAPFVYTPGEGWSYEPVGGTGKWMRTRAKDQLAVSQEAFDKKDFALAQKAAHRVVRLWPLSDYAPQAQYLLGRCYEQKGWDQKAFKSFQTLLEKYPKAVNYQEVLQRQYEIAGRFLAGEWFRLWNYFPLYPSMEKTAGLYEQVVKNGPYTEIGPQAQMRIGAAREKQSNYPDAVKAYELAADRYHDQPKIAAEAVFKQALAYEKMATTAEYDQNTAAQAIATFTDFMTLFPDDPRVPRAQKTIGRLHTEQARGSYEIARYYEKNRKWNGALVYYNEVLLRDPLSPCAAASRERIDQIKKRLQTASK